MRVRHEVDRHRFAAWPLAIVLAVVAGVGMLLIGMSAAPELRPGDAFQVKPRSALGATATGVTFSAGAAAWTQSGTCDPPYGDTGDGGGDGGPHAVLPPRVHLDPIGHHVVLSDAGAAAVPSRTPVILGCRGPPASVTH
ncbi:hypothetical protein [Micromonospora eburnea]|uniref:Uncharacterized protein n=1 Tax=Micromonospora eburnea TaxID=227316 RepID=A0A1C6UKP9_9ACTN|nr:hypothetical protein [Micromonospora eburnea]SCL54541.1 hypothetical protein GA0070604_3018 [Micromonospora eburnea]